MTFEGTHVARAIETQLVEAEYTPDRDGNPTYYSQEHIDTIDTELFRCTCGKDGMDWNGLLEHFQEVEG